MKAKDVESMTALLKAHGVPLSAVRANKLMLKTGLLKEATRESSTRPGIVKKYKVLGERGLDFGVNEENPQSPEQTSPYYYPDSFGELAALLLQADESDRAEQKARKRKPAEKKTDSEAQANENS